MRTRASLLLIVSLVLAPAAHGQRAITVRADNDAFNFWQMPWARPDEEYTSGVRITMALDGGAGWARRLGWALGRCDAGETDCATHTYTLGQDIYTAMRPKYAAVAMPGERPDAGVLWVAGASRVTRQQTFTELGWTIGVTGRPSLAEQTQRLFHEVAPHLNRPITWGERMPAEPVFAVAFDRGRSLNFGAFELQPHGGASLGTLLTEARVGVGLRSENNRVLSWLLPRQAGRLTLDLLGDAQMRAVARNVVLSGTYFRESPHIALRPFIHEFSGGLALRLRAIEISWLAHQTSAEHVGRTRPHNWSTLTLGWRAVP